MLEASKEREPLRPTRITFGLFKIRIGLIVRIAYFVSHFDKILDAVAKDRHKF